MAKSKKGAGSKGKSRKTVVKTKNAVKNSARKSVGKSSASSPASANRQTGANKVLEYKLFVEDSVRNLEDQVNYYIGKGWSPVGGVVVQGQNNYMQTMVRQED
ncbi:MAG: hypothetical protein M3Q07_24885 [Pseudobdellovibrionaceae bacterium]|nr:hypothetical protein [Pseudobdellovibrionaceae bacterium]